MRMANWLSIVTLAGLALTFSHKALAVNPEDDPDYKGKSAEDDDNKDQDQDSSGADIKEGDENKKTLDPDDIEKAAAAEKANSTVEDPKETYYFVGLRYRAHVVPKFMMNLFGSGGTTVVANAVGPEFTIRKNGFEYVLSAFWTGYYMPWTSFKGSSDGNYAYERVKSNINVLYFTADFNWTHQISPAFGLNFGFGAGIGYVWGDLFRRQAYPRPGTSASNPDNYIPCEADPAYGGDPHGGFCGTDNHHYGNYNEPSWANGGQKPMFFPWLAVGPGIRVKPHRNIMFRVDMGWALVGPYIGIAGNYGI
jgi:hypothetical protein